MTTNTFERHVPRRIAAGAALAVAIAPLTGLVAAPAAQADMGSWCNTGSSAVTCGPFATATACEADRTARGGVFLWPAASGTEPARVQLQPCAQGPAGWTSWGPLAG